MECAGRFFKGQELTEPSLDSIHKLEMQRHSKNAPGQEYELIDEFAAQLNVRGWYVWQPDSGAMGAQTISADAAQASSAPSKTINSPAAMMYLVAALDRLDGQNEVTIRQIATEAALKGTSGLDLNSTEKIHVLSAFGSERFSGLECCA